MEIAKMLTLSTAHISEESVVMLEREVDKDKMGLIVYTKGEFGFWIYCPAALIEDEEYQVLYIGKSNSEKDGYDILNRLSSHETIQQICRDKEMDYRDMEIVVQVISVRSKLFKKIGENSSFGMMIGDSSWEVLLNIKQNHEVIELIEAILINHFKPKYNYQYKEKIDRESKVYKKVVTEGIDTVSFEFDMSTKNGKMKLVTSSAKTETKMRTLVCRCENDEISINYDDLPDYVYDVLGGM